MNKLNYFDKIIPKTKKINKGKVIINSYVLSFTKTHYSQFNDKSTTWR